LRERVAQRLLHDLSPLCIEKLWRDEENVKRKEKNVCEEKK
jgi:hypothetical protein